MTIFILSLFFLLALGYGLMPGAIQNEFAWDIHHMQMACIAVTAYLVCPFQHVHLKVILLLAALWTFDLALTDRWFLHIPDWFIFLEAAGFIAWAIYAGNRVLYSQKTPVINWDDLDRRYFYRLNKKPKSDLGVCIASIFGFASQAIFANGYFYGFKAGLYRRININELDRRKYHVVKEAPINREGLEHLEAMRGTPWTLKRNCISETVLKNYG